MNVKRLLISAFVCAYISSACSEEDPRAAYEAMSGVDSGVTVLNEYPRQLMPGFCSYYTQNMGVIC